MKKKKILLIEIIKNIIFKYCYKTNVMSRKQRTCLDKKDKRRFILNIYLNKDKYFIAIYVYA